MRIEVGFFAVCFLVYTTYGRRSAKPARHRSSEKTNKPRSGISSRQSSGINNAAMEDMYLENVHDSDWSNMDTGGLPATSSLEDIFGPLEPGNTNGPNFPNQYPHNSGNTPTFPNQYPRNSGNTPYPNDFNREFGPLGSFQEPNAAATSNMAGQSSFSNFEADSLDCGAITTQCQCGELDNFQEPLNFQSERMNILGDEVYNPVGAPVGRGEAFSNFDSPQESRVVNNPNIDDLFEDILKANIS